MLEKFLAKFGIKEDESRKIYLLLVAMLVGVAMMFMSKTPATMADVDNVVVSQNINLSPEEQLEQRLEEIFSKIQGAGKVDVSIIFAQSGSTEYAINASTTVKSTVENSGTNGENAENLATTKEITEETSSGDLVLAGGSPVALSQSVAEVQGVLVVAEGGSDANVRANITAALSNLLDVPVHKVVICTAEGA